MSSQTIPVFDASSEFHQNLGLLKVADMASRKYGDVVCIKASDVRDMVLLNSSDSVRYWRSHQGHFQMEQGAITTNATITRLLLGDRLDDPDNTHIWDATRSELTYVNQKWDEWAHRALVDATKALVSDVPAGGNVADMRPLCRLWSIRALCPVLFGNTAIDIAMADGLMAIEQFYFAMSTKDADETAKPFELGEFKIARGFLDDTIRTALSAMQPEDETVIARINRAIPSDVPLEERIACLRPTLGRLLLEKLNIDGLGLLWTLAHLAQDPALVTEVAGELEGKDIYALPDAETPLTYSVVQEGQRLYPELPFIYRVTSQDIQLGGYSIPSGTTVVFSPLQVHRDKRYWVKPELFNGHRFLLPLKDKSSYLPFGVGPRVRARTQFLQHQLSIALRVVCSSFQFSLAPECKRGNLRPILRSTMAPRGAIPMAFEQRFHQDIRESA